MVIRNNKMLILGTIPPPIGGVSIHTDRLISYLKKKRIPFKFLDIRRNNLKDILVAGFKSEYIHLHTSNSYFRLLVIIFFSFIGKRVIFTFHGNLGRYKGFRNFLDVLSIKAAFLPILINDSSYKSALRYNSQSKQIPAFIPPQVEEQLPKTVTLRINELKETYGFVFATNAFGFVYDRYGRETYQITTLIELFSELKMALVVADPSGSYKSHYIKNQVYLPSNILLISERYSFYEVLKLSDCLLRITTTDGDSLSVKEALHLNRLVVASNVVNRPEGTFLVGLSKQEIREGILIAPSNPRPRTAVVNGAEIVAEVYQKLINSRS